MVPSAGIFPTLSWSPSYPYLSLPLLSTLPFHILPKEIPCSINLWENTFPYLEYRLNSEIELCISKLEDFNSKLELCNSKLEVFNSKLEVFNSKLEDFNSKLEFLNSKLEDFNSKLEFFNSKLEDFNSKLEFLNSKLEVCNSKLETQLNVNLVSRRCL